MSRNHFLTYLMAMPLAWMAASCADAPEADASGARDGNVTMVINISDLSSTSPTARAEVHAASPEQISTLRVIIGKPDGSIEANRLIVPSDGIIPAGDLTFEVRRNELKTVLLVANEASVDYDLGALDSLDPSAIDNPASAPGGVFDCLVGEPASGAPVPMTAVYRLSTSIEYSHRLPNGSHVIEYNLNLMRTLAKFIFNITNLRSAPLEISAMSINDLDVSRAYLFPRVAATDGTVKTHCITARGTYLTESGTGLAPQLGEGDEAPYTRHFLDSFTTPAPGLGDAAFIDGPVTLDPGAGPITLERYHLESRLPAEASGPTPYLLTVAFDGNVFSEPLTNLPSLPRNTAVEVNVTFSNNDKILEVEVLPYSKVDLNPGFE